MGKFWKVGALLGILNFGKLAFFEIREICRALSDKVAIPLE